jgi:hypothetical protein
MRFLRGQYQSTMAARIVADPRLPARGAKPRKWLQVPRQRLLGQMPETAMCDEHTSNFVQACPTWTQK